MPLHTPSPHRFLAPAPPSTQKPKPKSQSALRHVSAAQTPRTAALSSRHVFGDRDGQTRVTPAKRFVVVPSSSRKTSNAAPRRRAADRVDDEWAYGPATPRPKPPKLAKVESIDTTSPSSSANTEGKNAVNHMPLDAQAEILGEQLRQVDEEDEILFVTEQRSKRRRVSPHPSSSPVPARSDPTWPDQLSSPRIPSPVSRRFKISAPRAPVFDNTSTPTSDRHPNPRPYFILPPASPSSTKSATPLPETFSPSRKTGKYIANGMASMLQSWIIETANTGYSANTGTAVVWGRDKEDGVRMKIRVSSLIGSRGIDEEAVECWPGGIVFLHGSTEAGLYNALRETSIVSPARDEDDQEAMKIMLAGQGRARGKGGVLIRKGGIVGVRAPMWDVNVAVEGRLEKWLVGVEWVVL